VESVERVRAMIGQALAEVRTRGAARVTALHLVMYDDSPKRWKTCGRRWRWSRREPLPRCGIGDDACAEPLYLLGLLRAALRSAGR